MDPDACKPAASNLQRRSDLCLEFMKQHTRPDFLTFLKSSMTRQRALKLQNSILKLYRQFLFECGFLFNIIKNRFQVSNQKKKKKKLCHVMSRDNKQHNGRIRIIRFWDFTSTISSHPCCMPRDFAVGLTLVYSDLSCKCAELGIQARAGEGCT